MDSISSNGIVGLGPDGGQKRLLLSILILFLLYFLCPPPLIPPPHLGFPNRLVNDGKIIEVDTEMGEKGGQDDGEPDLLDSAVCLKNMRSVASA